MTIPVLALAGVGDVLAAGDLTGSGAVELGVVGATMGAGVTLDFGAVTWGAGSA